MRLAIADPPYLGRASYYAGVGRTFPKGWGNARTLTTSHAHPEALVWDDPATHEALVNTLADYDGWAIALYPDNLRHYLAWVPPTTRVASWHQPDAMPTGRIIRSWEPVLVYCQRPRVPGQVIRDTLTTHRTAPRTAGTALPGSKPPAWTRWVLDMLGYDPDTDTVDDLFGGSGAVTAEINQGVLL